MRRFCLMRPFSPSGALSQAAATHPSPGSGRRREVISKASLWMDSRLPQGPRRGCPRRAVAGFPVNDLPQSPPVPKTWDIGGFSMGRGWKGGRAGEAAANQAPCVTVCH